MWPQGVPAELVQSWQGPSPCRGIARGLCWGHVLGPLLMPAAGTLQAGEPWQRGGTVGSPCLAPVLAGLDPPRHRPPRAGAGLGRTGSPVGSDFSPGSSARLPPHSCPLPLLLLAGGACPSSGPIPGTWPSLPKAAPTPPPCTAPLTPSASPGPRGVMSGATPDPPPGAPMGPREGRGRTGHPLGSGSGGAGWVLTCLPHAAVGHPPASCRCAALSPACLLAGSRQEGAVAPPEPARSCRVPVPPCQSGQVPSGQSHARPVSPCPLPLPAPGQPWCCPQTWG